MSNPFSLSNRAILVTGASSGIGRCIAVECSKMGAVLHITGRNVSRLQETMRILEGEGHQIYPANLNSEEDINRLCNDVPSLDGVVHCAGINKRQTCKEIVPNTIEETIAINFNAPVLLQKQLLKSKKINKNASIVIIASRASNYPAIGNAVYSASKGAIISYSKCLALELCPRMIRVNCISPAMVWTNLALAGNSISEEELKNVEIKYPLKRFGKPEDIAYLAIYLLSEASSWMTGNNIEITGGGEGTII